MMIPFVDLKAQYKSIKNEIDSAIAEVLTHTQFIQGEQVQEFEKTFASYNNSTYCIGLNSGTDALILGVRALGLESGEVLVAANTYFSGALAVSENGLKPVFVDIDSSDYGISLDDLRKKVTSRTRAIILTHLYGQPDKINEVLEIIKKSKKKIHLIEDVAQAHGATYLDRKVGSYGIFGAFSFYPGKNLGAYGDAGALVTNDSSVYKNLKLLREYGQEKKYFHKILGVNSRLDTIQAAVLNVKLKHLDSWNKKRREHALTYSKLINEHVPVLEIPKEFANRKSVYHLYVIRTNKRDKLLNYLRKNDILAQIHYPIPLHLQKGYKFLGYKKGDLPIVEEISSEILSLPMYPELKRINIEFVVGSLKKFFELHG